MLRFYLAAVEPGRMMTNVQSNPNRSNPIATFITNIKFLQQGIKDICHTTKRAAIFKAEAKKLGAKVKEIYWTLGEHDGLLILEAPDDETATAAVLHLGAMGNVHTTTCRAFTAAEVDQIVSKVHGG